MSVVTSITMAFLQGTDQGLAATDQGPKGIAYFFIIMLLGAAGVVAYTASEGVNALSVVLALGFVGLMMAFVWLMLGQGAYIYP